MGTRRAGRITRFVAAAAMAAVLAGGAAAGAAGAQDDQTGLVRVVHGLRGLVADIYLDGTLALPTFQPERSTDPLPIPAGDHLIEIRAAGAAIVRRATADADGDRPGRLRGLARGPPRRCGAADAHCVRRRPERRSGRSVPAGRAPCGGRRGRQRPPQRATDDPIDHVEVRGRTRARGRDVPGGRRAGRRRQRARRTADRRVRRRHGELHVPHRLAASGNARLGRRAGGRPAVGARSAIQTGDGSTLGSGDDGGLPVALIATAALIGAGGVAVVGVRLRRARASR